MNQPVSLRIWVTLYCLIILAAEAIIIKVMIPAEYQGVCALVAGIFDVFVGGLCAYGWHRVKT